MFGSVPVNRYVETRQQSERQVTTMGHVTEPVRAPLEMDYKDDEVADEILNEDEIIAEEHVETSLQVLDEDVRMIEEFPDFQD
jgi:hypothetical protein